MQNPEQETVSTPRQTEKERLELIEKKVEIKKKRIEVEKEKLSLAKMLVEKDKEFLELMDKKLAINSKRLDNKKSKIEIDDLVVNRNLENQRLQNDKIFQLLFSLIVTTIDEERTILGSEPFYTPVIAGERREIVLKKLMELIKNI
ncbi:MAG: hypothetical protein BGO53_02220 [Sphingobacteriales bacterium 39-19]|nr:hypothetical protein [Sphingobacteriales bacterium]OJW11182.1 MAG: hypothetical protein BGO53_02220 [Sphingobacteriales bacterium 39-19]